MKPTPRSPRAVMTSSFRIPGTLSRSTTPRWFSRRSMTCWQRSDSNRPNHRRPTDRALVNHRPGNYSQFPCPVTDRSHTDMQFDRMVGTVRVVNAGSVGMPFENPAPIGSCPTPMFSSGTRATILCGPPTTFAADSQQHTPAGRRLCRTQRPATPIRGRDTRRVHARRVEVGRQAYWPQLRSRTASLLTRL